MRRVLKSTAAVTFGVGIIVLGFLPMIGNLATAATPATLPGGPTSVTAVADVADAALNWVAPATGAPITGYVVTPIASGVKKTPVKFSNAATTELITGLQNGVTYTFTVSAVNAAGTGPASSPSNTATPLAAVNDGASLPAFPTPAPWPTATQSKLLNQSSYAWSVASGLLANTTLTGTLTLLSDAGIQVVGSVGDNHVYVPARAPFSQNTQIRAGEALVLNSLASQSTTYSLSDLLSFISKISDTTTPSLQIPTSTLAAGLFTDLTESVRNPIWSAVVLGGPLATSPVASFLQAESASKTAPDVQISAAQEMFVLLRVRMEFTAMLQAVQSAQAATLALSSPASTTSSPCEIDNPIGDGIVQYAAGKVAKGLAIVLQEFGTIIEADGSINLPAVTGSDLAKMLGPAGVASALAHILLEKASTQLDASSTPIPLVRTKTTAAGEGGNVTVHAQRQPNPTSNLGRCANLLLAMAGLDVPDLEQGDLKQMVVTYNLPDTTTLQFTGSASPSQFNDRTNDSGIGNATIQGSPQTQDLGPDPVAVNKTVPVSIYINPDTAESWWKTDLAAIKDAIKVLNIEDPWVSAEGALAFTLRALHGLGWLNTTYSMPVTDWRVKFPTGFTGSFDAGGAWASSFTGQASAACALPTTSLCTLSLTTIQGTTSGFTIPYNSTYCTAPAALADSGADITLSADGNASIDFGVNGPSTATCNTVGWNGTNDGNYPPALTAHWTPGSTESTWNLLNIFLPSQVIPISITWIY